MSTHNICFYWELTKIIFQLSPNTPFICSSAECYRISPYLRSLGWAPVLDIKANVLSVTDMGTDLESEFLIRILKSNRRVFYQNKMKMKKLRSTQEQSNKTSRPRHCMSAGERMCEDGSCIARIELCRKFFFYWSTSPSVEITIGMNYISCGIHFQRNSCKLVTCKLNTVYHFIFVCSLFRDCLIVCLFVEFEIRYEWRFPM